MTERPKPNNVDKIAYLSNLYSRVIFGDPRALLELSKIALGGFKPAQTIIDRIDIDNSITTVTDTSVIPPVNNKGGGVQLGDWSTRDQERMRNGERPQDIPTHRNL
ncbi:hypothetical protein HYT02_03630 [Candidatus Gottesmanbacteria bacterium]|nr:hypothetical protein [Candidatus Gottesmanbacteria bacterium]